MMTTTEVHFYPYYVTAFFLLLYNFTSSFSMVVLQHSLTSTQKELKQINTLSPGKDFDWISIISSCHEFAGWLGEGLNKSRVWIF